MADIFATAAKWLDGQRRAHLSRPVVLVGASDDVTVSDLLASIGRTLYETANDFGAVERWESRDYIVSRADLPRLPVLGDRIIDGEDIYEVSAPRGMPVWSPADSYGITISIHTTLTS